MSLSEKYKSVPNESRPKIRWWLPGTLVDEEELACEIRSMKQAGFAGAEISPTEYYHPELKSMQMGWGQERWYHLLKRILEEAQKQDFEIDLSVISSAPIALPTITDVNDPKQGAQMELDGAHIDGITKENPYRGFLPVNQEAVSDAARVNGKVELYAVTVAKYADKERHILCYDSAEALEIGKDVYQVGSDALSYRVEWVPQEEGEYVLFAWWQHPSGEQVCGMLQIDYYSKEGAVKTMEYYEQTVLPALGDAKKYLTSLFVDSLEYRVHLDSTRGMREKFIERYGYDFAKYLPAVYEQSRYFLFGPFLYDFSFDQHNEQLIRTHGEFLTELYIENHLKPLAAFCEKHGLTLRYQTSYGKFLELARTAKYVHIPETETLYGKDIIDFYRLQAGAVHITGKPVYSVEASAERPERGNGGCNSGNYEQTFKNHLWHIQRAYAGGVNQVYFHGQRYRGQYKGYGNQNGVIPDVKWPGYECHGYLTGWSNSWDERQPNWNGMQQLTDFLARTQFVLQLGVARVDLAVYWHSYWEKIDEEGAEKLLNTSILEQEGFTYDFISPAYLKRQALDGKEKRLFIKGPQYKALIFENSQSLPIRCINELIEIAEQDFPIIFIGDMPYEGAFHGEESIQVELKQLLEKDSVYRCDTVEQLPQLLKEIHIYPDVEYENPVKVLNVHRHTENAEYYYLYHYADADIYSQLKENHQSTFKMRMKGRGIPYIMDAWTGSICKLKEYHEIDKEHIEVSLTLAEGDSRIIVLDPFGNLTAATERKPQYEKAEPIWNWTLQVESWTEGSSPVDTKKEIVYNASMKEPIPWTRIEGMDSVSGVGIYRSEFQWNSKTNGLYLSMQKVEDCYVLKVNGKTVPANQIHPLIDIGPWLQPGTNSIEIAVFSTLMNAVIKNRRDTGSDISMTYEEFGITGPVLQIPY